jgi:transcriptional regulator with XRE-family HTH domain
MIPTIDLLATGKNIQRLRKQAKIPVSRLADKMGITIMAVYKWQKGNCLPSLDNLVALSSILNVRMDEIIVINGKE